MKKQSKFQFVTNNGQTFNTLSECRAFFTETLSELQEGIVTEYRSGVARLVHRFFKNDGKIQSLGIERANND